MTAQEIAQNAFTAEIQDRYELQAAIEAYAESLVAECREQTVRECAEAAMKWYDHDLRGGGTYLRIAILAVAAPKPPVWCEHWKYAPQYEGTWINETELKGLPYTRVALPCDTRCPICGAPRPEVTK